MLNKNYERDVFKAFEIVCKILKIPDDWFEVLIKGDPFYTDEAEFACALGESYRIVINEHRAKISTFSEILLTVAHEARHLYQHLQIDYREQFHDKDKEDIRLVKQWNDNFNNYIKANYDEALDDDYFKQSVEVDAIAFSYFVVKECLDLEAYIPAVIKKDVLKRYEQIKNHFYAVS